MSSSQQSDPSKNVNQFNKFLANNTDFLTEKYNEHFAESFPFNQLQTKAKIELGIKFIYDVFSFEKYQKDEKMNITLKKSLRQNILGFLKGVSEKDSKMFTAQEGIKLLKYCIENNQMFAVHYDKKEKKQQQPQQTEQKQQSKEQKQQKPEQQPEEKENQQYRQQQVEEQNQTNTKIQANQSNLSKKSKSSIKYQPLTKQPEPQVIPKHKELSLINNEQQQKRRNQILKKQAKTVFDFYCKQQLNSGGPNATFDKILHQANTMTLGKFMAFANTTQILYTTKLQSHKPKDHVVLDKKTINEQFRKVSKGQKEIEFEQFFDLLKKFHLIDNTVYDKLNMGKSETLNKIVRKLRYLNTPFSMKGYLEDESQPPIDEKIFVPISTLHSGRFQSSIREDMEERKMKLRLLPHQPYPNPNQIKAHDTFLFDSSLKQDHFQATLFQSKIKLTNKFLLNNRTQARTTTDNTKQPSKIRLQNSRVSFDHGKRMIHEQIQALQNLIVHDDNDDVFLKDYKIPKLNSNAGLKKKHLNSNVSNKNEKQAEYEGRKFSGLKTERKNVVGELKERIKEVENNERKQLTGLENKRRAISNINKY